VSARGAKHKQPSAHASSPRCARAFRQRQEVAGGAVDEDVQRAERFARECNRALRILLRSRAPRLSHAASRQRARSATQAARRAWSSAAAAALRTGERTSAEVPSAVRPSRRSSATLSATTAARRPTITHRAPCSAARGGRQRRQEACRQRVARGATAALRALPRSRAAAQPRTQLPRDLQPDAAAAAGDERHLRRA
jgi:hypothetical protein